MPNGYKINRSNYTLKTRKQTLSGGVVYERDFMTTTNLGAWDSGSIPYGENNFKIYYNNRGNAKKRPYQGEWFKNECSSDDFWTAGCVPSAVTSEQDSIKLKPNYNTLLDFAYYGNCTELIKSTISKVIKEFPAEMYSVSGDDDGLDGQILKNPFGIDLKNETVPENANQLRYFLRNFGKYDIVNPNGEREPILSARLSEDTDPKKLACDEYEVIIVTEGKEYVIESKRYAVGIVVLYTTLLPGWSIRPKEEYLYEFYDGLDDFGRVLLNRMTTPIYTAVLDTPFETERGVEEYRKNYTWPTENGWNVSIEGKDYENYIDSLLNLADFYDEYYTNNLWRMLTHDSIKAMDLAFSNPQKDEDSEDYNAGTTKLEGLFWAIGRQFDEIKRAIDNIKNTNRITYDGNNNLPDYFLSDALNLGGWEIYNIDTELSKEDKTEPLFDGVTDGYTAADANSIFLRNLKINSKRILSKKGTRDGIESLLGLFGLMSYDVWRKLPENNRPLFYDYKIDEYVGVVVDSSDGAVKSGDSPEEIGELDIEHFNNLKLSISTDTPEDGYYDTLEGVPDKIKYVSSNDGTIYKYIVPWFDRNKKYDGGIYYQMNGGWAYHELEISGRTLNGYDETVKYLIIVNTVSNLKDISLERLYDGVIAYVENVEKDTDPRYYILNRKAYYFAINDDENKGWQGIPNDEVEAGETERAKKIWLINNIVENYEANNPHVGYGNYDGGKTYIEYLERPVKYTVDAELFGDEKMFYGEAYDCNGTLLEPVQPLKIDDSVVDNMRCWYFNGEKNGGVSIRLEGDDINGYHEVPETPLSMSESGTTYESSAFTFDFITKETGDTSDEITADSIVSTKCMSITFYDCSGSFDDFKKYIATTVMPYLKQVIPSTSIFSYSVEEAGYALANALDTTGGVELTNVDAVVFDGDKNSDDIVANFEEGRIDYEN